MLDAWLCRRPAVRIGEVQIGQGRWHTVTDGMPGLQQKKKSGGRRMQGLVGMEDLGLGGRRRAASAVGELERVHGTGADGTDGAAGWRSPPGALRGREAVGRPPGGCRGWRKCRCPGISS